eukprot:scaffold30254_cov22-Tisochrysis_lutea.AAC.1
MLLHAWAQHRMHDVLLLISCSSGQTLCAPWAVHACMPHFQPTSRDPPRTPSSSGRSPKKLYEAALNSCTVLESKGFPAKHRAHLGTGLSALDPGPYKAIRLSKHLANAHWFPAQCSIMLQLETGRHQDAQRPLAPLTDPQLGMDGLASQPLWQNELRVAIEAATDAGNLIRSGFSVRTKDVEDKKNTSDLVTETDVKSEEVVFSRLRAAFPTHVLIGEESSVSAGPGTLTDEPTWMC